MDELWTNDGRTMDERLGSFREMKKLLFYAEQTIFFQQTFEKTIVFLPELLTLSNERFY